MIAPEWLERIIVVPRNGLGNRLQAWSSSAIAAAHLDVPLGVMWEPEDPSPASASALFDSTLLQRSFIERAELDDVIGAPHEELPRHLTVLAEQRLVVLAGHDMGEQHFMRSIAGALADDCRPHTLLIIAGGLFHLPGEGDFSHQREIFYRQIAWHPELVAATNADVTGNEPYGGLHIRQTDRSREAPTRRTIRSSLERLADVISERSLFVAADTAEGRERWSTEAAALGFHPWSAAHAEFERTSPGGALAAALDWLILARATGIAYPAASTFSAEAVIAAGARDRSVPMSASVARQRARVFGELVHAGTTYPTRRWGRDQA